MKPIVFEEVEELFENSGSENKLNDITLSKHATIFGFRIIRNGKFLGLYDIVARRNGKQYTEIDKIVQKEYEILNENGYVK